jgi:DNA-binding transcriptional LysR family regulator
MTELSKTGLVWTDSPRVSIRRQGLRVNIEARPLRQFVAVAEELHFGRAAQRLHMAQPALSPAIRQLEVQLGVQLFERTSRSVRLTAAGSALLERAPASSARRRRA